MDINDFDPQPINHPQQTPPEQSVYINDDSGSQWHGQQYQFQYYIPPPVAQSIHNSYQPTTGYSRHNALPPPAASLQPQPASYLHPQRQQQERLHHTWHGQDQFQYHVRPPVAVTQSHNSYQPTTGYVLDKALPPPAASLQSQPAYYLHPQHQQQERLHHTWHGQHEFEYHVPPPVAQPSLQPVAQSIHNSYRSTAGYAQHNALSPPAASLQPQPAYYPHPQPQQQESLHHTWHGQHQFQYHVPPLVAQPSPQPVTQSIHNSYQPTTDRTQHKALPLPAASLQPQPAYYPHPQPQQQKRLHHTLSQDHLPAKRQRSYDPDLNRRTHHHAPQPPQPQFQPPSLPTQDSGPSQGSSCANGDNWLNNVQRSANKGGRLPNKRGNASVGGNYGGSGRSRGARGGLMSGNRGEIPDRSHMDSTNGDRRGGQSGGGVRAHGSRGNLGGAAITQAEGCNSAEPPTVPVVTQFQDAQNVNVSGNPTLMNIGTNLGDLTTVHNYGGSHGLERLEKFVSFAALHNSAEQDRSRRCHPGTREDVLRRLRHWFDNPNPSDRIFWLHGPAGAGKSAIAQTISQAYKRGEVAATFFFYRSDPNRNDGNRLFTTIAWQLAFSIPTIKDFIVQALDKLPHLPRTDVETQFEELVANPTTNITSQMLQPAPVVIIDGSDECSDEHLQKRFLTVIGDAVKDPRVPLRFLICSRPEVLIEETLDQFKEFTLRIDLATIGDSKRDIEKYLVDQFSAIVSKRGLDPTWPGQEIIDEIVFKSSGNFILASTLIRFISDEDYSPQSQLDIVRKLKPPGPMSPFALLDELYLEILKQQRDQDFLKTFLALFVGRSSINQGGLHKDDATLMNVSEEELHSRLRKMRSLFKFKPFIDVYHKSFLDFLQDGSSRSAQYHVSKHSAQKRYLELIVHSVVRHVSMAFEQPNSHGTCRSSPVFKSIVRSLPPKIVLPVEDWQETLKPLLDLQDKLIKTPKLQSCRITQVMRDLLLHLMFLQEKSHRITVAQAPESNRKGNAIKQSRAVVTKVGKSNCKKDLDSCLSALLSCLQNTDSVMVVDRAIIDHMFSLLAFDYAETVARVRTVSDGQKLIDVIALLTNNESFLSQCGRDAACKAARLASGIFARVPHLPQSLFLNKPCYVRRLISHIFELQCQTVFISRILDHNHIVPVLGIHHENDRLMLASGNENEQDESVYKWLKRSSPNLITRIRVMLEVARTIRYIHSMDVALYSPAIDSKRFTLDSNLRVKVLFIGPFAWWVKEASAYDHEESHILADCTCESNVSAFARLLHLVCFDSHKADLSNRLVKDARQLIERCCTKDPKSRPTMKDVVTEMETWK